MLFQLIFLYFRYIISFFLFIYPRPSLSLSSHIFYKIIHTDSTSVNVLLINIFTSKRERGNIDNIIHIFYKKRFLVSAKCEYAL